MIGDKNGGLSLSGLVDINKWQQIQDYFSEVIGAGLRTLDREGRSLTKPSGTPHFCSEVMMNSPLGLRRCRNCRPLPLPGPGTGKKVSFSFPCPAGPQNFVVPVIVKGSKTVAYIIVGPVLFGKREEMEKCEEAARDLEINKEHLLDALREIKTFTFRGIQSAVGLLEEVGNYICRLSYEKLDLGIRTLESSFTDLGIGLSASLDDLLRALLDVTLKTMKAEMGSIMLLDQKSGELFIKIARGLKEEIIENVRIKVGEGIAGLVARDRHGLLVNEEVKDPEVKGFLKRPEIQSALVAPLEINNEFIGILNVSTAEPDNGFTRDSLNLITQLVNRAGEMGRGR